MGGCPDKCDAAINKFRKSKNNMQKHMNTLKKHNKMIFKLVKKNSTHREMNNINKVSKASYE